MAYCRGLFCRKSTEDCHSRRDQRCSAQAFGAVTSIYCHAQTTTTLVAIIEVAGIWTLIAR